MTTFEDYHPEVEPDDELERQAAGEGLASHRRPGAPIHDTGAERAALGAMLWSLDGCDDVIETGLEPEHFHSPMLGAIYAAIRRLLAEGTVPDSALVASAVAAEGTYDRIAIGETAVGLTLNVPNSRNGAAYARRIIDAATLRRIQANALEVAQAAASGQLDEALRLTTTLTDAIPANETEGSWTPVDLTAVLAGDSTGPTPTVLAVDGAEPLFYDGRTNLIFGESGAGKTWVALAAVREAIWTGRHVIYIDLEDSPEGLVSRLQIIGCTDNQIANGLIYLRPELAWGPTAQAALTGLIDANDVALVVVDSTGEAMAADGVKGNDDDEVARWFTACPKFMARRGPAVIVIDHLPKDDSVAPLSPIGSQRKQAAIDGASYRIDALKRPSKGHPGLLSITVGKDRHGARHRGQKAAELALVPSPDGGLAVGCAAPQAPPKNPDGTFRPTKVMESISRLVEEHPGLSGREIESRIRGKAQVIREATRLLIAERYLDSEGDAKGFRYRSARPYRADQDTVGQEESHAS